MTIKNENLKPVTFSLRARYKSVAIFAAVIVVLSSIFTVFLILTENWLAIIFPILSACIPIPLLAIFKHQKEQFITISSEGLTFCGTVDPWRNYRKDFSIVHHFRWEEIRQLSFTRIATAPAYLFIDPNEGETKCIFIYRGWNLIDKLRNFTGFHGCKELGNHFQYIKQEGLGKAGE